MRRLLAAAVLAAAALLPAAAYADPPTPGGTCDEPVDFDCREPCTAELDCGLIPPCAVWAFGVCVAY
jgi:hypothetical protein